MNETTSTSTRPNGRRTFTGILLTLVGFYTVAFTVLYAVVDFEFPMVILAVYFVSVAVPFALVFIGLIYFIYLVRLQLGSKAAQKPGAVRLASLFVAATVIQCGWFIVSWPETQIESGKVFTNLVLEKSVAVSPDIDQKKVRADVNRLWTEYTKIIEYQGGAGAEKHPELMAAFITAATIAWFEDDVTSGNVAELIRGLDIAYPKRASSPADSTTEPTVAPE